MQTRSTACGCPVSKPWDSSLAQTFAYVKG